MRESVPFTIEVYEGLAQAEGILHLEGGYLVLEWQVKDGIFGVLKGKIKRMALSLEQVREVELRKRMWPFRSSLRICVTDLRALEATPGTGSELRLLVARRNRKALLQLAGEVRLQLSEVRLRQLDQEIREARLGREAGGAETGQRSHDRPAQPLPERRF